MLYDNTPVTAATVGWSYLPEYCFGDLDNPYVFHDVGSGEFHFITAAEYAQKVLAMIKEPVVI